MTIRLADNEFTAFIENLNALALPPAAVTASVAMRAAAAERGASRPKGPEMHAVADLVVPASGTPPAIPARHYRQTGLEPILAGAADFDLDLIESRTLDGHTPRTPLPTHSPLIAISFRRSN